MSDKFFKNIKASLNKTGELPREVTAEELLRSKVGAALKKKSDVLEMPDSAQWNQVAVGGGAEVIPSAPVDNEDERQFMPEEEANQLIQDVINDYEAKVGRKWNRGDFNLTMEEYKRRIHERGYR